MLGLAFLEINADALVTDKPLMPHDLQLDLYQQYVIYFSSLSPVETVDTRFICLLLSVRGTLFKICRFVDITRQETASWAQKAIRQEVLKSLTEKVPKKETLKCRLARSKTIALTSQLIQHELKVNISVC